jgi:hypothetical protein
LAYNVVLKDLKQGRIVHILHLIDYTKNAIMKKTYLILFALAFYVTSAQQPNKFPETDITNGFISAHFYLPKISEGYYQATRFDWSGLITSLVYKGHDYYGQWYENYSPTTHDAVMGPVEEFQPVGFKESEAGGSFLKIGVGVLTKPDTTSYSSFKLYPIANHGTWKVSKKEDQIQFTHILNDIKYSYEYQKNIQLTKGKPEMTISHSLKNTGNKIIETSVYDHNFLVIDKQPTGPGYVVKFPVEVTGSGKGLGTLAQIKDKQMSFPQELTRTEYIYCAGLEAGNNGKIDYDIKVDNIKTGAGVRITCDRPLLKLVFWASSTTVCPEPYIQIKIEPGQEFSWKITYNYYTLEPKK